MRIALLTTFHESCGIATYAEALVPALEARGAEVRIFAPTLRPGVRALGSQPPRLWQTFRASSGDALRTFAAIVRSGAEVVHIQMNHGLYSPRFLALLNLACRAARLPLFVTLHGRGGGSDKRRRAVAALERALFGAHFIVHNEEHARELGRGARVIPHGVPTPRPRDLAEAKRALGIDPAAPVLAHFGFLHPDKGIEEVLEAVAALKQGAAPALRYHIVGGAFADDESQQYLARLEARVRALGLASAVRLSGRFLPAEEVVGELQAADWIVLNYRTGNQQGTSGAARHALEAARPLALSQAPLFDDLRKAAHTLEPPLGPSLARLLSDEGLRARATERALAYGARHDWPAIAAAHLALFSAALG